MTRPATFATDGQASYFAALGAIRLRALLRAERWAEEGETFDLVLASALARLPKGGAA